MTPGILARLLDNGAFGVFARIVLTFMFWSAGLGMAANYSGLLADLEQFGVRPTAVFAPLVIASLLIGSALIIANRWAWLGCGILAGFTALTIPIVHAFWKLDGPARLQEFHVFVEHVTVIGAMMVAAVLCRRLERERGRG